jgi:cyclic pyranopterin monophosphate synthase
MSSFTHIDSHNQPSMVDISDKGVTKRSATAQCFITVGEKVMALLENGDIQSPKGPVFQTAIIVATMAAKKTSDLIPFCHPIPLEKCKVQITALEKFEIEILVTCQTTGKTGIEMEALTAASVAALCIYDMCKALSKDMIIHSCQLLEKTGGKSDYKSMLNTD